MKEEMLFGILAILGFIWVMTSTCKFIANIISKLLIGSMIKRFMKNSMNLTTFLELII